MLVQIHHNTRQFTGVTLEALPEFFHLSPKDKIQITAENAEEFGYIPVAKYFQAAVTEHIESIAQNKGYDDVNSARSYAGDLNPFQEESKQFVRWSAGVWSYCFTELTKLENGERDFVPADVFVSELPSFDSFASV